MVQSSNDAVVKDAQTKLSEEEYALGMGQRLIRNVLAAVKVVQIRPTKGECARSMGQSENYAAVKGDARIKLGKEECAVGMGQSSNAAAVKDVQNMSSMEKCV